MINKSEINMLLDENKYNKAFDVLYDYYTELMRKLVEKNDIEYDEDDMLIDYIRLIEKNLEKYKEPIQIISASFFDESLDVQYKVESLLDELNFWEDVVRGKFEE